MNLYSNETQRDEAITSWNVILLFVDQAENKATRMDCAFFRDSLSGFSDAVHLQNNTLEENCVCFAKAGTICSAREVIYI